jgi:hypothetical protein
MIGVAFDLRRTPFVALDEQSRTGAVHWHGGREEERLAGHLLLGLADVGNDLFGRLTRAGRARERGDAPINFRNRDDPLDRAIRRSAETRDAGTP